MKNRGQLLVGSIWNRKKEPECCPCPDISKDADNIIECRSDGLYATATEGGVTSAEQGLSDTGGVVTLGQDIGEAGNPAALTSNREIPLNGNNLAINGTTLKYTFEPGRLHLTDTNQDAQITARAASFSDTSPAGTSLIGLLNTADYFQMVLSNSTGRASLEASTVMSVGTQTTDRVDIITNGLERISILGTNGNVGIRTTNPTAQLHLPAGATGAQNAPLKFTSGALMVTPETGAVEFDGTHLYFSIGSTRYQIDQQTGTQGLDSVLAQNQALTANRLVSLGGHNIHFVNGFIGIQISPTAHLHLAGGGVSPGQAPLKFGNGAVLTTAEQGAVEYDGTNLFFTRTGTTRETIFTGVSGATAPGTTAGGTITNHYGGNTNFLGDPNSWASVVINGTTYKIPLYT